MRTIHQMYLIYLLRIKIRLQAASIDQVDWLIISFYLLFFYHFLISILIFILHVFPIYFPIGYASTSCRYGPPNLLHAPISLHVLDCEQRHIYNSNPFYEAKMGI